MKGIAFGGQTADAYHHFFATAASEVTTIK